MSPLAGTTALVALERIVGVFGGQPGEVGVFQQHLANYLIALGGKLVHERLRQPVLEVQVWLCPPSA